MDLFSHLTDGNEKFWKFHRENPKVYELFKRFAFEAINAGRTRFSADAIWHRIRWFTTVETNDENFKLNDKYRSYYGRLFVLDFPQHATLFEMRKSKSNSLLNKEV